MVTFHDGPAKGANLMLSRAPILLRVVVKTSAPQVPEQTSLFDAPPARAPHRWDNKVDALDQPEDVPADDERVYVYRRVRFDGRVHLNTGRRAGSGFYAMAHYAHIPHVSGEQLRDREAWVAWAEQHGAPEGTVFACAR